jgi:hypothetical protein
MAGGTTLQNVALLANKVGYKFMCVNGYVYFIDRAGLYAETDIKLEDLF